MNSLFNSDIWNRIRRMGFALIAVIITTVAVITILVMALRDDSAPREISTRGYNFRQTENTADISYYQLPRATTALNAADFGMISGKSTFYLGQLVDVTHMPVLANDSSWYRVETGSKSLEMEVFKTPEGEYYIQAFRCASSLVSTTRGLAIGMTVEQAMALIPKGADVSRKGNDITVTLGNQVMELLCDGKSRVVEIQIYYM